MSSVVQNLSYLWFQNNFLTYIIYVDKIINYILYVDIHCISIHTVFNIQCRDIFWLIYSQYYVIFPNENSIFFPNLHETILNCKIAVMYFSPSFNKTLLKFSVSWAWAIIVPKMLGETCVKDHLQIKTTL